jgi:hypothetical protein
MGGVRVQRSMDILLIFIDVPLAWIGSRVLWLGSLGRTAKPTVADLVLLRRVKSGSSFFYWLFSVIIGATTMAGVVCALVLVGPIPQVHEW